MDCSWSSLIETSLPNVSSQRSQKNGHMMTLERFFMSSSTSTNLTAINDSASEAIHPKDAAEYSTENEPELISSTGDSTSHASYPNTPKHTLKMASCDNSSDTPSNSKPSAVKKTKKKPRASRCKPTSLKKRLKGLNADQFIELIQTLTDVHPELNNEIENILPKPDLSCHRETLEKLNRCIHKSMPYTRYGSSRDAFCYRRVAMHLQNFKNTCLSLGRRLVESEAWQSVIEYTFIAWDIIQETPLWDNPSHNKSRELCFRGAASMCLKALKKSNLEEEAYTEIKDRLQEAAEIDTEIQACVAEVGKILQKF